MIKHSSRVNQLYMIKMYQWRSWVLHMFTHLKYSSRPTAFRNSNGLRSYYLLTVWLLSFLFSLTLFNIGLISLPLGRREEVVPTQESGLECRKDWEARQEYGAEQRSHAARRRCYGMWLINLILNWKPLLKTNKGAPIVPSLVFQVRWLYPNWSQWSLPDKRNMDMIEKKGNH